MTGQGGPLDEKPPRLRNPHRCQRASEGQFRVFEQDMQLAHGNTELERDLCRRQFLLVFVARLDLFGGIAQARTKGRTHLGHAGSQPPARHDSQSGDVRHLLIGIGQMRMPLPDPVEMRPKWPSVRRLSKPDGKQIARLPSEHSLMVVGHGDDLEVEILVAAWHFTVRQIGIVDRHVTVLERLDAVASGLEPPTLHLKGDAEAVSGDARNVGFD